MSMKYGIGQRTTDEFKLGYEINYENCMVLLYFEDEL
jgi:hypothetical protein